MGSQGELSDYGILDRRDIAKKNVKVVFCEQPATITAALAVIPGEGFGASLGVSMRRRDIGLCVL